MASRTTFPFHFPSSSSFVNYRAYAQIRAWKTYHELQENTTIAADENESQEDLQRELESSGIARRKRERDSGGWEARQKVVRRLNEDEIRLTQTGAWNPPGATQILVPTYDDEANDSDWRPHHGTNMMGVKRPGFRPSNTLNESTPQSGGNTFWSPHIKDAKLPTQTVAGGNVRKEKTNAAFESHQAAEHSSKRQKLSSSGGPSRGTFSQAVDLTDDATFDIDVFTGVPHAKNHRPSVPTQSTRRSRAEKMNDPFAAHESAQAASFTTEAKQSQSAKRRSGNETRNSSQRSSMCGSARSPPIEIQDNHVENPGDTRHSPMVIGNGTDGKHESQSRVDKRRLPIDLGEGLPETKLDTRTGRPKSLQGSKQDLRNTNDMLAPAKPVRPTNRPPAYSRTTQVQEMTSGPPREPERLNSIFKRDAHIPGHSMKARDRMRADSRDGRSSPDELEGVRTIPSLISPRKPSEGMSRGSAKRNGVQQRCHSPGSVHRQTPGRLASPPSVDPVEERDDKRIAIRSIFSKQCVQQNKSLALVWDDKEEHFLVACGEVPVRLPYRDTLVSIGKSDVLVSWTHNSHIAKAMLKGSAADVSNGTIVIDFEDERGLNSCYNYLYTATRDHMKSITVVAEQMEKVFKEQSKSCTIAHQRLLEAGSPVTSTMVSRRAGGRRHQIGAKEEIQYESGSDTPRGIPFQKQNAAGDRTTSRYFAPDATRRSTRQAKPSSARPKSPTPSPRWSEVNPPVTWQHPVVYPSQGARRVTVFDSDVCRLDEGEFLNDNLLGYAIRYIEENMSPVHKQKVHFFSTFFYSSLMKNKRRLDYDAVKRWTKNIDIFTVPYTVVPINNDLHWYFAIICNMQFLDRKLSGVDGQGVESPLEDAAAATQSSIINVDDEADEEVPQQPLNGSGRNSDDEKNSDLFAFEDDGHVAQAGVNASSSRPSTATGKKAKKKAAPTRKYDTNAPVIIMLDSFGHPRAAEINALKRYIQAEAKEKRAMDVDIGEIQGVNAKGLPEQPNFCDCGVFVIGYLAKFSQDPDGFVKKLLRREMDPDKDFRNFKAPTVRERIRMSLLRVAREQDEERKAHKAQKKAKIAQTSASADTSMQTSPERQLKSTQDTPAAAPRAALAPALSAVNFLPSSPPFPSSRTVPHERSSPSQDVAGRTGNDDEAEEELEVSPPTGLTQAVIAPLGYESSSSSSLNADDDEEMLDVGDDSNDKASAPLPGSGVFGQLLPTPSSHNSVFGTAISSAALTGKKSASASSVKGQEDQDARIEVADSQAKGYS